MKPRSFLFMLISLLFSHQVLAAVVSPNSVVASSTWYSYQVGDLINEDGLTGGLEGGLHGEDYDTMWLSDINDVNASLTFDMGEMVNFLSAYIWQYNSTGNSLDRGIDGFDILYSSDGVNFDLLGSSNLAKSPGGAIPAQVVPLVATARYIRFEATSNYGDIGYTGLSEVAFSISDEPFVPAEPAEPVPTSSYWALIMLTMLIGLMVFANRRRLL